jgi:molybdopterin synthase catalytic subunit
MKISTWQTKSRSLRGQDGAVGAVCSFVGTVRDRTGGEPDAIQSMALEHYPGMTEQAIETMIDAAQARFDILGARVIHRVGLLQPLDQIVLVLVTSAHRGEELCRLRVSDGLPENPGAVLEKRTDRPGGTVGRCTGQRRRSLGQMGHGVQQRASGCAELSRVNSRWPGLSAGWLHHAVPPL